MQMSDKTLQESTNSFCFLQRKGYIQTHKPLLEQNGSKSDDVCQSCQTQRATLGF